MRQISVSFADQSVLISYPDSLQDEFGLLPGQAPRTAPDTPTAMIIVQADQEPDRYVLQANGRAPLGGLDKGDCLNTLLCELGQVLLENLNAGVGIHAGAVAWHGLGIVIPGLSGSGKSSLTAWLIDNGFDYLSDELVVFGSDVPRFTALSRPLILRGDLQTAAATLARLASTPFVATGSSTIILPSTKSHSRTARPCRLLIFPCFAEGEDLSIEPLTPARSGLALMACNVNARNLPNHGFDVVTEVAKKVPAIALRYGSFDALGGTLDKLAKLVLEQGWDARQFSELFGGFGSAADLGANTSSRGHATTKSSAAPAIPAATPRGSPKRLTIGMATYDDYDGVYFSLQAIRMYHSEILSDAELLVIDNNPTGRCAATLKQLEKSIPNYRYVPYDDRGGTTIRELVFAESNAPLVMCMDCHVFVVPGAVRKLMAYAEASPDSPDLWQGPLVYDDLASVSTHFEPKWRNGLYGCWATDERGKDPDAEPFEIPMQGLGLFACRKSAWPGFNPRFRGFGGEEGYLHEKFRQAGGRVVCLPFLRWMHRFHRPMGTPYVNTWEDRLRNYLIGFNEVGWNTLAVEEHFTELLGRGAAVPLIARVKAQIEENAGPEATGAA